jgi:signal transduction histidine kinase
MSAMNWFKNLKSNVSAKRTFIVLLLGFLIVQVAGIYSANMYMQRNCHKVPRRQFGRSLSHVIRMLDTLPEPFLQKHLNLLTQPGINKISFVDGPVKQSAIINSTKGKDLHTFAARHYYSFRASYQLQNGQWVYLTGGVHPASYIMTGFIITEIFLLILLVFLCVWVVQRLAIPVTEFEHAAKRFGVDLQAPPIAMQGTPEMQSVIFSFNEMQGRIRRLIMDRTQMLAAISHDLRTPITRLQLRIEALKGTEQFEKAESDLLEMDRMISSILSFARDYVHAEQMERFDLNALTENICNELEDTGMDISCHSQVQRLPYFGRMTAIKRALTNLFENAVKYGEKAKVSIEQHNEEVKIKIRDHGPGIPESEMEKVFAPFYRVDPSRTPEKSGTGLGMAVARDIIRAHGGDIALYNHEQGGLLVLITLPVATDGDAS